MAENTIVIEFRGDDDPPKSQEPTASAVSSASPSIAPVGNFSPARPNIDISQATALPQLPAAVTAAQPVPVEIQSSAKPSQTDTPKADSSQSGMIVDKVTEAIASSFPSKAGDVSATAPPVAGGSPEIRYNPLLDDAFGLANAKPQSTIAPVPIAQPASAPATQPAGFEKRGATVEELAVLNRNQKRVEAEKAEPKKREEADAKAKEEAKFKADAAAKAKADSAKQQVSETSAKMRTVSQAGQTIASGGAASAASGVMQIAGTGLLGGQMAALAAGPVGAIVAAAPMIMDAAKSLIKMPFEKARAAIEGMSQAGTAIAKSDFNGLMNQASEGVANFLDNTGPAGWVMAEYVRTVNALSNAVNAVTNAFVERGRELSAYDGRAALANANADVTKLEADIREAQMLGDDYARLTKSQSSIDSYQAELMLFLKSQVLGVLTEILEPVGEIYESLKPILKSITSLERETKLLATYVRWCPPVLLLRLISSILKWLTSPFVKVEDEESGPMQDITDAANLMKQWMQDNGDRSTVEPVSPGL